MLSFEEIDARGLLDGTAATGSFVADLGVEAEMDKEEEEDDDDDDAVIYGELNDDDDDESAVGRSDRVEQVVAKRQDAKCGDDEDEDDKDDEDDEDEVIYGELNDGGGILDADGNVRAPSPPGIEGDAINGCLRPAPAGGCARATALAPHAETTAKSVAATEPVLNGFGRAALGCALGIEGMPPSACAAYPVDLVDEHLFGAVTSAAAVRRSTAGVTTADPTTAAGTATCATISTVAARWHETDRFLALLSAIAELDPLGAAHGGDGGGSDAGCCVRVRERFVERLAAIWYDFDTLAACRRRPFRSWSRARRTIEELTWSLVNATETFTRERVERDEFAGDTRAEAAAFEGMLERLNI